MGNAVNELKKRVYGRSASQQERSAVDRLRAVVSGKEKVEVKSENSYAVQQSAPERAAAVEEEPNLLERAIKTATGLGKRQVAGHSGTAESLLEGLGKVGSWLQDKQEAKQLAQDTEYLERYKKELADALEAGDEKAAKIAQTKINQAEYRIKNSGKMGDYYDEVNRDAASSVDAFGDKMYAAAEEDLTRAKQGAGVLGSIAVDAGAALGDVLVDAVANRIVPGLGTVGRISRSYGHGSEAAEEKDLGFGAQVAYGTTSAALGELTNRAFSGNPILEKATGKGALDDILLPNVGKTLGGRMFKSGVGEALEEGAESVADIVAQKVIMGDKADDVSAKDVAYDALIGALVGSITGMSGKPMQDDAPNAAGERTDAQTGTITPARETRAQTATERNYGIEDTRGAMAAVESAHEQAVSEPPAPQIPQFNSSLLQRAVQSASTNGHPTNREIVDVASSRDAIAELGINPNGKTASQIRMAVRLAIENIVSPASDTEQTPEGIRAANLMAHGTPADVAEISTEQSVEITNDADLMAEANDITAKNTNLDINDVVKALPRAKELHSAATEVQSSLNSLLDEVAAKLGFTHAPDPQKSVGSLVSRIIRDTNRGKDGAPIKDAARGHLEMPSWDYLPRVIQTLKDAKIPYTAEAKNTDQGYRGLHLTWEENGVGIELQLSTPEAWAVKMKTEEIYAKWREFEAQGITPESVDAETWAAYMRDCAESERLWSQLELPDFSIWATTDSESRSAPHKSENWMGGSPGLTHAPSTSSNMRTEGSSTSLSTRPASVRTNLDIENTPSSDTTSTESVAQEGESVNETQISTPDDVNSVGAAAAGFETPGSQGHERTSNLATGNMTYNAVLGEATARNRRDYNALFRYQTQTEGQSLQKADNLLYVQQDGQRKFLRDVDEEAYQDLIRYLDDAPAWNSEMTDAAKLIETELRGRSVNGEIDEDEFVKWIEVMREHATETGRGAQAWAKWTRRDNETGRMSELDAWNRIQSTDLSDEEKKALFRRILEIDTEINTAQSEADLKRIILEIAEERGTLSGLTGKQSKTLRNVAEFALDGMSAEQLRQFAYSSSAALSTDSIRADWGNKVKTIQILNMLSNPKTPAKNIAGNTSFYALDAISMRGAAILDAVLSKVTGTRSVAWERSVLGRNAREQIAEAIRLSVAEVTMDVDMGGESRYGTSSNRTFKADGNFAERVMSAIERNNAYLLTTSDEAYKGAARSTAAATQKLIDEGKIKNAGEDYASEQADNLALYRTFQGDSKVTTAIQSIHDLMNMVGVGDSGKRIGSGENAKTVHSFGLGDMVAPFTRVAGNLAAVGVDYSPVNAVKGTVEILDTIRAAATKRSLDPAKQAKAVSDLARGMSGSGIAYGVMMLAKAGLLKRADDEADKDIASLNQSEGMTGTQVNIDAAKRWLDGGSAKWESGDTLIDVSNLEPINFIISLGVDLVGNEPDSFISTFGDVKTYEDTVMSALGTAGDLPILSNVGDFAKDVLVYGTNPVEAGAEMLGKTAVSSVTPNIVAAFAKGMDDKQRNIYSSDRTGDVLVDYFKSRIPGLREELPTTVNTLGEEKSNPGTQTERLLNAMLNPIGVNEYSQSDVSREMERVREKTGETGFYPTTRKPKELSYKDDDGKEHIVTLTYEQQQKFQSACSATQMSYTEAMMKSQNYKRAGAKEQAALLERCYDFAYQSAKAGVLGADAVPAWVTHAKSAKSEIGMSPTEYLYYYEKYGAEVMSGSGYEKTRRMVDAGISVEQWATMKSGLDADDSGSVKKAEVTAYIEKNFPKEKWSVLFDAYKGGSNWKNPY